MVWYLIVDRATSRLRSQGTVVADPLPPDVDLLTLSERPGDDQMWDGASRTFVPRPLPIIVDRLQDLISHPNYATFKNAIWDSLTANQKTVLRNALIYLLGGLRWREASQPVSFTEPEGPL